MSPEVKTVLGRALFAALAAGITVFLKELPKEKDRVKQERESGGQA